MTQYGIQIATGGLNLHRRWDGSNLIGIDDVEIPWGREDPYDEAEPSLLKLSLIDPTGRWATDENRIGQQIAVARTNPTNTVVFKGEITSCEAEPRRIGNPLTGIKQDVWIVRVVAVDPLGALAGVSFTGPAKENNREGLGGWTEVGAPDRIDQLMAAGANGIVSGIEIPPPPADAYRVMNGQAASDRRTALELIDQIMATVAGCFTEYVPATNSIRPGRLADESLVYLRYSPGRLRLSIGTGRLVPASRVGLPEGKKIVSTAADAIDLVQVGYQRYGRDEGLSEGAQKRTSITGQMIEAKTATWRPGSSRILDIDTQVMTYDGREFGDRDMSAWALTVTRLRQEWVYIVNGLNNQMRLPPLLFDNRRLPLTDEATEDAIYQPVTSTMPLYFAGSIYNGQRNAGPQYQIIGGTLRYKDGGWSHLVTVIAARRGPVANLTIDQLVPLDEPVLDDFDDYISLDDLGMVSEGAKP